MLFHQMVALLWSLFVLSPQCYFTSSPSKKYRICVHPCLLACSRDRKAGESLAMKPNCEKQRLEGTAELVPVCDNSDGHIKQNLKCSCEHFSFHSHRSHFGLVKWVLETEVKKKPQRVFLKTYLS